MALILDSDALIKLYKAQGLMLILEAFECLIPDIVYREVVTNGANSGYEDASRIRDALEGFQKPLWSTTRQERPIGFGPGESSTLIAFDERLQIHGIDDDAIVSDDFRFLRRLDDLGVPHFRPTDLIVRLAQRNPLIKIEALAVIENMRPFVRESHYRIALGLLEDI